jgi:hypothetical protein
MAAHVSRHERSYGRLECQIRASGVGYELSDHAQDGQPRIIAGLPSEPDHGLFGLVENVELSMRCAGACRTNGKGSGLPRFSGPQCRCSSSAREAGQKQGIVGL